MTDLTPMFERVDGALQCNVNLGDLVYADNPITFTPPLWVRVEKWQTTLDGDLIIEGPVDQPTETCPGSYVYGQQVVVRGSRVFQHVPADDVTSARIANFFADDTIQPPGLPPEDESENYVSLHERLDLINAALARIEGKLTAMQGDGK